jgi:hypothetical protein
MKVIDLKKRLMEVLEELEHYDDNRNIRLKSNTYWCSNEFFACSQGYVDFDDLVEDECDDEDEGDEYDEEY